MAQRSNSNSVASVLNRREDMVLSCHSGALSCLPMYNPIVKYSMWYFHGCLSSCLEFVRTHNGLVHRPSATPIRSKRIKSAFEAVFVLVYALDNSLISTKVLYLGSLAVYIHVQCWAPEPPGDPCVQTRPTR
jgi:hypothetical protein